MTTTTTGERIKLLRKRDKLTQAQLAEILGLKDRSTVGAWERNLTKITTPKLARLAEFFCISARWLVTGAVVETPRMFVGVGKSNALTFNHDGKYDILPEVKIKPLITDNCKLETTNEN